MAPTPPPPSLGPSPGPGPSSRGAIVLPGFDRREQLQLDFTSIPFGAAWFTRIYTHEDKSRYIQDFIGHEDRRTQESRLREIRYGNNITLLFRVCSHCSSYYGTPSFWPAIARGFSARPDMVQSMVDTLVHARRVYQRHHSASSRTFFSGANIAADYWISFIDRRSDSFRPTDGAQEEDASIFIKAGAYFQGARTRYLQTDSATMLAGYNSDAPRTARKRSRSTSPTPPFQTSGVKRRPGENSFDTRDRSPSPRGSASLPPRNTGLKILGQARQPFQTPVSASQGMKHRESFSRQSFADLSDRFTVHGYSRQDDPSNSLPPRPRSRDSVHEHGFFSEELGQAKEANKLLRDRITSLERKLATATSRLKNDGMAEEMENRLALTEKKLAAMDSRPVPKDTMAPGVQTILASFEKQLVQAEERRVKDMENAQAMIASLESKVSVSDMDESPPKQAETIQQLQSRIASFEVKLASNAIRPADDAALRELGTKIASLESRLTAADAQPKEADTPAIRGMIKRLTCLEDKLAGADISSDKLQIDRGVLDTLEARLTLLEGKEDQKEHVRELKSRLVTLELRQENLSKPAETDAVTKGFVQATSKRLNDRLSSLEKQQVELEKLAATKTLVEVNSKRLNDRLFSLENQLLKSDKSKAGNTGATKEMQDRITTLEFQASQLLKQVDMPKTPKSPSPLQDVQHNMEDVLKRIKSLATMSSVSEKTFQIEQNLRGMLEKHQRDTNERMADVSKDLETVKAQIKGLVKLLNETTSNMAKRDSVKALRGELAILAKRLDIAHQDQSRSGQVAELEHKVTELGNQIRDLLRDVDPVDLSNRLQELHARMDGIQPSAEADTAKALAIEVASLHDRVDRLTAGLTGLVQELTRFHS